MDTWQPAYDNKGNRSKRFAYGKFGLYLIRHIYTKQIRYIGMSKFSIAKALYRHFNKWNDVPQRVVYHDKENYEVRVIILPVHLVCIYEKRLIRYFRPADNHEYYDDNNVNVQIPEELMELEEAPF